MLDLFQIVGPFKLGVSMSINLAKWCLRPNSCLSAVASKGSFPYNELSQESVTCKPVLSNMYVFPYYIPSFMLKSSVLVKLELPKDNCSLLGTVIKMSGKPSLPVSRLLYVCTCVT